MRRGGMGAVIALALVATLVSAINPGLLIAVPLAMLLVALPPARSPYRVVGVVLLALLFATPPSGTLWYAERGWALMLGAAFLLVVTLRRAGGFLGRGLAAVGATLLAGGVILLATGAWSRVEWAVAKRFREAAAAWTALLDTSDPSLANAAETLQMVSRLEVMLYPAMLGLASLAALAVAWWGYRRLIEQSGEALSPMREFRFTDHLVWILIAGAVLLVLPLNEVASRAGANLTTFMAALYVLRGAAIVLALIGSSGVGVFLLCVMAVLLLPLVAGAALVIGLSDTWLDLRRRVSSDDAASS